MSSFICNDFKQKDVCEHENQKQSQQKNSQEDTLFQTSNLPKKPPFKKKNSMNLPQKLVPFNHLLS